MNLLETIKKDSLEARKSKSPNATFLVTLYSECATVGKNKRNGESTNEEVVSVLKKFKAGAQAMINAALTLNNTNAQTIIDQANNEIKIVEQYLPQMLSEEDLRYKIKLIVDMSDEPKQMGKIMGHLKESFPGLYDGALASKIIKELLG